MVDHESWSTMSHYECFPEYPDENETDKPMINCPTCRGTGVLLDKRDGDSAVMFTFTSIGDHRLKPKRPICYVIFGISCVGILAVLISYFIYPRPMLLTRDPAVPEILSPIWTKINPQNVTFAITNSWLLYNANYLPVSLLNFTIQLSWSFQPSAQEPYFYSNNTAALIPPRTEFRISQEMIINFSDDMGFMWWYCQPYYYFTTNFQAVATVSVMGLISPDIVQTWQKTTCYQNGQNNKTYNKELGPKLLT